MSARAHRPPRVVSITAGGAGMFCGSCMRDNAVAAAVRSTSEAEVVLLPTFTPIRTDEEDVSAERVALGGVSIYLHQKLPWLSRLPRAARRLLDSPALLRAVSRLALQTRGSGDGAIAVELLKGLRGRQRTVTEDLVDSLAETYRPELVNVSNLLIAGFVPALRRRLDVPVVATLQGDDIFLATLTPGEREEALDEMRRIARQIDAFAVFSRDFRDRMAELFDIPLERFEILPLGVSSPEDFVDPAVRAPRPEGRPPTLGYLARLCPEKGFHHLVDAFLRLRQRPATGAVRLRFGGWLGAVDRDFFELQMAKIESAGALSAVTRVELPDRSSKIRFFEEIDVFSVPTVYREPKGLYVLESLASGVPVVQPAHGAFPEMLASAGGGVMVPPGEPDALAEALAALLLDPSESRRLGEEGRRGVLARHGSETMARATVELWLRALGRNGP
ncbi:MAG: glycosyltransferase family 4 protein [Acidobacteriota bacterium]